jgi:spoIIIJ-associated protein
MTEEIVSDVLDNILGLLLLEGSYDVQEDDNGYYVAIETENAGKLIGFKGEHLNALQLLVNLILSRKVEEGQYKRVIVDVSGWRKNKEEELKEKTQEWIAEVVESGEPIELEPMPSWQRRVIHMMVQESGKANSESEGEGRDRHLVIRPKDAS